MHGWLQKALVIWIIGMSLGYGYIAWHLQRTRVENCARISKQIQTVLQPDVDTLIKIKNEDPSVRNSTGYSYYRSNPNELNTTIESAKARIKAFDPGKCK